MMFISNLEDRKNMWIQLFLKFSSSWNSHFNSQYCDYIENTQQFDTLNCDYSSQSYNQNCDYNSHQIELSTSDSNSDDQAPLQWQQSLQSLQLQFVQ